MEAGLTVSWLMELSVSEIRRVYEARQGGFFLAVVALLKEREAALDAVQDGFAQALAQRKRWHGGSVEAWVWRIIERKALDEIRRRRRVLRLDEDFASAELLAGGNPKLVSAVSALAPRRRLMVFLHYFADLPYAEVARICSVSEGTVAATLAQARAELERVLREEVRP